MTDKLFNDATTTYVSCKQVSLFQAVRRIADPTITDAHGRLESLELEVDALRSMLVRLAYMHVKTADDLNQLVGWTRFEEVSK